MSGPLPSTIETDLPCVKCGYNLRGLSASSKCPECNHFIQKSLPTGELLTQEQIQRLTKSMAIVLGASTCLGVLAAVLACAELLSIGRFPAGSTSAMLPLLLLALAIVRCIGMFGVTNPSVLSRPHAHVADQRPVLRATSVIIAVSVTAFSLSHVALEHATLSWSLQRTLGVFRGGSIVISLVASIVSGIAVLSTVDSIADRVSARHIRAEIDDAAKGVLLIGFFGSLFLLAGLAISWIAYTVVMWRFYRVLRARCIQN